MKQHAKLKARIAERRGSRGYTAVEVLMAMTLFAIGGAGVIAMQKVTIQGGEDARRFDMATSIANEWLSRLQRDAAFWTEPSSANPTLSNLAQTKWLSTVGACANAFCAPASVPTGTVYDGVSGAFDMFGRDVNPAATPAQAWYCAQYRLTWMANPGVPAAPSLTAVMRAEVRVYYNRLELVPVGTCSVATGPPESFPTISQWHVVYAATAIRENARR